MQPLSRETVRALDRRAIEEYGIPSLLLMENAGRACAAEVDALRTGSGDVVVFCGPGNNGGDGLVIARTLDNQGIRVRAFFCAPLAKLASCSEDVRTNAALWRGLGRELEPVDDTAALAQPIAEAAVVVDALFGTGLTRPLRDPFPGIVSMVNEATTRVLAVDVPSGLDADTGEVLGAAVRADVTVTFVAPKLGFGRANGPTHCGRIVTAEIGIPRAFVEAARSD